jgi:hypothetical protein
MSQPHIVADIQDAMTQLTQLVQFILPLIMCWSPFSSPGNLPLALPYTG